MRKGDFRKKPQTQDMDYRSLDDERDRKSRKNQDSSSGYASNDCCCCGCMPTGGDRFLVVGAYSNNYGSVGSAGCEVSCCGVFDCLKECVSGACSITEKVCCAIPRGCASLCSGDACNNCCNGCGDCLAKCNPCDLIGDLFKICCDFKC